jgi:hypothetical protein
VGVYAWLAPEEKWEGDDENADDGNIEGNPRNSHAIKVITVDDGPLGIKLINDPTGTVTVLSCTGQAQSKVWMLAHVLHQGTECATQPVANANLHPTAQLLVLLPGYRVRRCSPRNRRSAH